SWRRRVWKTHPIRATGPRNSSLPSSTGKARTTRTTEPLSRRLPQRRHHRVADDEDRRVHHTVAHPDGVERTGPVINPRPHAAADGDAERERQGQLPE